MVLCQIQASVRRLHRYRPACARQPRLRNRIRKMAIRAARNIPTIICVADRLRRRRRRVLWLPRPQQIVKQTKCLLCRSRQFDRNRLRRLQPKRRLLRHHHRRHQQRCHLRQPQRHRPRAPFNRRRHQLRQQSNRLRPRPPFRLYRTRDPHPLTRMLLPEIPRNRHQCRRHK